MNTPELDGEAEPSDPALHRALAGERRAAGDELGALAHLIAAQTLEAFATGAPDRSALALSNVGTGYFMKGERGAAARWYRLVLTLDPNLAVPYQNLAAIYHDVGREAEAEACRRRAYEIQCVFTDGAGPPARRVLILCAGGTAANIAFEDLVDAKTNFRIKYAIDYAAKLEDDALPAFDIVFNAIGEPDVGAQLLDRLTHFADECRRPLLNSPRAVANTQRHRLPELLRDIPGAVTAPCIRLERPPTSLAELAGCLANTGIVFPVLVRPVTAHGGEGLVRCETIEALHDQLLASDGAHYLTAFHDSQDANGLYRKYRVIFVDGAPFPYHLAISSHWMVHYFSADMEGQAARLDEERRFLANPAAALGTDAMAVIAAIGRRLGLDYAGIDFSILPDGRVLVFEANATMLAHKERAGGPLAHKNLYVQAIFDAFGRMLARRCGEASRR